MEFFHTFYYSWQLQACSSDLISAPAKLSELSQSEEMDTDPETGRIQHWQIVYYVGVALTCRQVTATIISKASSWIQHLV